MGSFKCILTFETEEDMEEALASGQESLENHFSDVRKWLEKECRQSRQVWVEYLRVPPHGWFAGIFKSI